MGLFRGTGLGAKKPASGTEAGDGQRVATSGYLTQNRGERNENFCAVQG